MFKPILPLVLLTSLSITASANITSEDSIHKSYTLTPNIPRKFDNPFIFPAKIGCTIETTEGNVQFDVTALKRNATINQKRINTGQTVTFTAESGARFRIEARGKARMKIISRATRPVIARCKL